MPLRQALDVLRDRDVRLEVLAPPYPSVGTGTLRVMRAEPDGEAVKIVAAYDGYERL